jgi:primosomal protein N'
MFVIEVIPLKKGIGIESLSYYSSVEYTLGTVLSVPVRNKKIEGIVIRTKPVSMAKTALRTATFSLKKLEVQKDAPKIPQSLIATAQKICERIPAQIGSVLFSMLPADIRSGERPYPQLPDHIHSEVSVPSILTESKKDRYVAYRSHIRQSFAHRGSVLFVVPTSIEVEHAATLLSGGIEKRVITFSSAQTKRQTSASYAAFEDLSQSKLIVTTPNFAFLCRHDITTIIVESAGSPYYVSRTRPYLDARESLKIYAKTVGCSIILGDTVPQTEDEIARRDEKYSTFDEHTNRIQLPSTLLQAEHPKESNDFKIFTKELSEYITRTIDNRGRVFLYSSRRGLAPIVICNDCGHIFRCPDSGAPYSLLRTHKDQEEFRWFYCGTSGKRVRASDTCPDCGSWRLREQGIGIQQVYDYVKKEFPGLVLFLMDHTTANTHRKAKQIAQKFYDTKKAVLVGTNLALPYLTEQIECTAVISYEAMRAVPTWRADETVFSQLMMLRELTSKDLVVQTRSGTDELLTLAEKGLVDQFYDGEIDVRKALSYPPYSTFILLTWKGTKEQTLTIEETVKKQLIGNEVACYNSPLSTDQKTIRYGLLRIPSEQYPSPSLISSLRNLPPYIKIEINPAKII